MADVKQGPGSLNSVSFLWDPTRDTGIFVKVNCISTEFTPKKHGGERGVPFRLQVLLFPSKHGKHVLLLRWRHIVKMIQGSMQRLVSYRLDVIFSVITSPVLQVFKLKGADRKHKQDREKLAKRPDAEREKFSPQVGRPEVILLTRQFLVRLHDAD